MRKTEEMMCKIGDILMEQLDKGIESIDAKEFGCVVDIYKDLAMTNYYENIVEAMEHSEYGKDYDVTGMIGNPMNNLR